MRRLISGVMSTAVAAAGAALVVGPLATSAQAAPNATPYALWASGFGTQVRGGAVPAESDKTAHEVIGCTTKAGLVKKNFVAEQELGDAATVSGVKTQLRTARRNGTVSSISRHRVAKAVVGDSATGQLLLEGVRSTSRAFHDKSGYHATATTDLGSLSLLPPGGGEPQELEVPDPGETLTVPGVATVKLGATRKKEGAHGANALATSVVVKLIPTDTTVNIARSRSGIAGQVTKGLFHGNAYASQAKGLDDSTHVGRNPLQILPCVGTRGEVRRQHIAGLRLGDGVRVSGLRAAGMGDQDRRRTHGFERGSVAKLNLGGADGLKVTGIVGRVQAARTSSGLVRNAKGTTVGKVVHDGETYRFPKSDEINIPGVVNLERKIVTKPSKNSIKVTALRVTLLDGSGAVINLGNATIGIKRSGR